MPTVKYSDRGISPAKTAKLTEMPSGEWIHGAQATMYYIWGLHHPTGRGPLGGIMYDSQNPLSVIQSLHPLDTTNRASGAAMWPHASITVATY